jgi:ubiquinone/menaquinone biosynthesis C-methylase UbiE
MEAYDRAHRGIGRLPLSYTQLPEADAMRTAAGDCAGEWVLDAGCGSGRRTPPVRDAEGLAVVDFSWAGLIEFSARRARPKPDRIQADVTRLPFREHAFDTVLCGQVLPHIQEPEQRHRLIAELARVAKPSGRILISTLHFNFRFKLLGLPKEGRNEEDCYFYRDTLEEFRALLSPHLEVEQIWGCWIYLPRTYSIVNRLGRFIVYWDRIWRNRPLALRYGKTLLAFCRPRKRA